MRSVVYLVVGVYVGGLLLWEWLNAWASKGDDK